MKPNPTSLTFITQYSLDREILRESYYEKGIPELKPLFEDRDVNFKMTERELQRELLTYDYLLTPLNHEPVKEKYIDKYSGHQTERQKLIIAERDRQKALRLNYVVMNLERESFWNRLFN